MLAWDECRRSAIGIEDMKYLCLYHIIHTILFSALPMDDKSGLRTAE